MKRGNKIAVIIVLVIVILFGVGQFFAGSNLSTVTPNATSTTNGSAPATPPTQVIAYTAAQPASSTPVESGYCWTGSIAAPYRSDAYRCGVGNSISDPCFQIPNQAPLLCGKNPARPNSTSTFVLKLTQPLPAQGAFQGPIPSNWAWLVQLSDGTLCSPFTGTRPFTADNQAASYGCAPGPLGSDVMIFDDLNASGTTWMATIGTLSEPTSTLPVILSSSSVPVATVWQ